MSRLDEVFEVLHDVILERFRAERGGDVGNAFVAFEFGTPIPGNTFRLKDQNQTVSPELAVEFLSQHANTVPEVKGMLFRRRPFTVEAQYGLMLAGAMPVDASSMEMLGAVKREATADFEQTLGSLIGPYRFRPVFATPVDWYDESQEGNWTHIVIDRSQTVPPRPTGKLKIDPMLGKWRIASEAMRPALHRQLSNATIAEIKVVPGQGPRQLTRPSRAALLASAGGELKPAVSQMTMVIGKPFATAQSATQPATHQQARAKMMPRVSSEFAAPAIGANVAVFAQASHTPSVTAPTPRETIQSLVALDASFQLAKAIEADVKPQDVVTDQFGIKVDVCMITLHRPWLSDALLTLRGWFLPGFEKGELANEADEEDGPFALLPTACIVIRKLEITAQWSKEDHAAIDQSANLGSFNLFGRSFGSNSADHNVATLSVPGMQSIAWVCEPMPLLPPANAPS